MNFDGKHRNSSDELQPIHALEEKMELKSFAKSFVLYKHCDTQSNFFRRNTMKTNTTRRAFLKTTAAGFASAAVMTQAPDAFAEPMTSSRASVSSSVSEYKAIDFEKMKPSLLQWPSEKTVTEHLKLYTGYVKKANEIMGKLKSLDKDPKNANQTFSDIRELKVELTFAIGGIKNHEIYFDHLGGPRGEPTGKIANLIDREFGSIDDWRKDLKATGIASRGWS